MGRKQVYGDPAAKQRAYRARQALKRNAVEPIDVTKTNQIYCMEALPFLQKIPSGSSELVITSPPYNLRNSTGGFWRATDGSSRWSGAGLRRGYDSHDDNMPRDQYVQWQRDCVAEMVRIVGHRGAVFYNHKPRVQAGRLETPDDIVRGFPVRQIIIWNRKGGLNFNEGYFLPTYEFIYLICGPGFKLRPGANRFGDVWTIAPEQGNDHPAPFPIEIPDRILSSVETEMVIDPFMGSGTVGVAAKRHGIKYLGCDISPQYIAMAEQRIEHDPGQRQSKLVGQW